MNWNLKSKLKIEAFSQENLTRLIQDNSQILKKEIDSTAEIAIVVKPNIDWDECPREVITEFSVPAFYIPIEEYENFFPVHKEEIEMLKELLSIQKNASQDDPNEAHHFGTIIFMKLITAYAKLEQLSKKLESVQDPTKYGFIKRVLDYVVRDITSKLKHTKIVWEYKEWTVGNDFKRYDEAYLLDLNGGKKLFDEASKETLNKDVFAFIENYLEEAKKEEESKPIYHETVKVERKPISLILSSDDIARNSATVYYQIIKELATLDEDDGAIHFQSLQSFIWKMDEMKEANQFIDVELIIIDSAPPYFAHPTLEQFQLMKKYGIYNYGLTRSGLDYDNGCIKDIKGILRLIKGEYPELPLPIVISDGSVKKSLEYSENECIAICSSDYDEHDDKVIKARQHLLKRQQEKECMTI